MYLKKDANNYSNRWLNFKINFKAKREAMNRCKIKIRNIRINPKTWSNNYENIKTKILSILTTKN